MTEQKVASLYADIGAKIDNFTRGAASVKGGLAQMASGFSASLLTSAAFTAGITAVGTALQDIVRDQIEYANQVRTISKLSGASAEDTSRMIQVLDDYKLTTQDLMMATKALTKEGHAPSITALGELSDKYKSLNTVEEKNKFLVENLGRSGLKWAEIMEKGSKAINEQGAAISKNLILTQKAVDDARKAEMSMDAWNDAITGVKTALAIGLLPALTSVLNTQLDHNRAVELAAADGVSLTFATQSQVDAYMALATAERKAAEEAMTSVGANGELGQSAEDAATSANALTDALKAQSEAHQDYISSVLSYAGEEQSYLDNQTEGMDRVREAQIKLSEATAEYGRGSKEAFNATTELNQAKDDLAQLEVEWKKTTAKMVFDLMQTRIMSDGIMTDIESNALTSFGLQSGLFTEAQAAQTQSMYDLANSYLDSMEVKAKSEADSADAVNNTTSTIQDAASIQAGAIQGVTLVTYTEIDAQRKLQAAVYDTAAAYSSLPNSSTPAPSRNNYTRDRLGRILPHATGGDFLIPASYGNEGFQLGNGDTASAGEMVSITPKGQAKGGNTYNIVINNPKREAAEADIRRALKNVSYTGAFA